MKLSAWLSILAAVLGQTKSKPADIERAERAAQVADAIETALEGEQQQPPADK